MAEDSADSMWQQGPTGLTTRVPDASAPWQQPPDESGSPGAAAERWQKQSPAEASSNATASTAIPRTRIACLMAFPTA